MLEMLFCSGYPTQIAIAQVLALAGLAPSGGLSLPFVAAVSLIDAAVLVGMMSWLIAADPATPPRLWRGSKPLGDEMLKGVLAVPPILFGVGLVMLAVQRVAPWLHNVPVNPLQTLARGGTADALLLGVVAIVAGAGREELQRAFLLDRFERHLGPTWLGILTLSALFGLGHSLQGWDATVVTGVLGAVWAAIYARRRSVVIPLVSHALFNAFEVAQMMRR